MPAHIPSSNRKLSTAKQGRLIHVEGCIGKYSQRCHQFLVQHCSRPPAGLGNVSKTKANNIHNAGVPPAEALVSPSTYAIAQQNKEKTPLYMATDFTHGAANSISLLMLVTLYNLFPGMLEQLVYSKKCQLYKNKIWPRSDWSPDLGNEEDKEMSSTEEISSTEEEEEEEEEKTPTHQPGATYYYRTKLRETTLGCDECTDRQQCSSCLKRLTLLCVALYAHLNQLRFLRTSIYDPVLLLNYFPVRFYETEMQNAVDDTEYMLASTYKWYQLDIMRVSIPEVTDNIAAYAVEEERWRVHGERKNKTLATLHEMFVVNPTLANVIFTNIKQVVDTGTDAAQNFLIQQALGDSLRRIFSRKSQTEFITGEYDT